MKKLIATELSDLNLESICPQINMYVLDKYYFF